MPARLPVEVESLPGCTILRPAGEIDCHTAPEFRSRLLAQLEGGPASLLVDLSGVSFIDSSGLRVLVECHKLAHQRARRVRLFAPSAEVGEILRLTRLDSVLELHPSRDAALAQEARP